MDNLKIWEVLKIPQFRNLWLSQLISQTALNTLVFSQQLHIYSLTRSNVAVAILILCVGLPNLLVAALSGVLVDRWDKKLVMFFAQFLRVLILIMFAFSSESILWIYTLMILVSCISQFWYPAEITTIPNLVKGPLLITANSIFTLTFFTTVIFGAVLSGPLLAAAGANWTYFIISGAFLISAGLVTTLPGAEVVPWVRHVLKWRWQWSEIGNSTRIWKQMREDLTDGLKFIQSNKSVSQAIFFLAASQTLISILGAISPGYGDRLLRIKPTDASLFILAPAALGMVVGAGIVSQHGIKFSKKVILQSGLYLCGLSLLFLPYVRVVGHFFHLPVFVFGLIGLLALGFGNALIDIPSNTILQEDTDEKIRSRVYGVLTAIVGAAGILPVMIAGALSDLIGVGRVLAGLGVVVLLLAFYNKRK